MVTAGVSGRSPSGSLARIQPATSGAMRAKSGVPGCPNSSSGSARNIHFARLPPNRVRRSEPKPKVTFWCDTRGRGVRTTSPSMSSAGSPSGSARYRWYRSYRAGSYRLDGCLMNRRYTRGPTVVNRSSRSGCAQLRVHVHRLCRRFEILSCRIERVVDALRDLPRVRRRAARGRDGDRAQILLHLHDGLPGVPERLVRLLPLAVRHPGELGERPVRFADRLLRLVEEHDAVLAVPDGGGRFRQVEQAEDVEARRLQLDVRGVDGLLRQLG